MSQSIGSKVKTFFKSIMKPSPAAVFQAVKTMKPHVRMIKFRYGAAGHSGGVSAASSASTPTASASVGGQPSYAGKAASVNPGKPNATVALPIIEDWQLPARYQRQPIDPVEMEYINRGGPE